MLSNIALGLQAIHKSGVMHRDLKPQNIFICESNQVKIGDFGVSGMLKSGSYLSSKSGTFAYMAPEMLNSTKYTNAVDVWSLGCIAYEMCELKMPFNGAEPPMVLIKNISDANFTPLSARYSQKLRKLISSMLVIDPRNRIKMDEIVTTLSDFYLYAYSVYCFRSIMPI
jgi:NIMA (never in mitosis gene a)-related kinase